MPCLFLFFFLLEFRCNTLKSTSCVFFFSVDPLVKQGDVIEKGALQFWVTCFLLKLIFCCVFQGFSSRLQRGLFIWSLFLSFQSCMMNETVANLNHGSFSLNSSRTLHQQKGFIWLKCFVILIRRVIQAAWSFFIWVVKESEIIL